MDTQDPDSFNHRSEKLSTGRIYHFIDQQPEGYDPRRHATLLCVHGFPDFWYGWRYQIGPWVRRGYRVVVPDMLGYGGSDKPENPSEYSAKKLCADLAALLDILDVSQAVLIGHDWGSHIVGRFALWHPERLLALVMMSVPYTPPSRVYLPVEEVAQRAPNLGYQVYFANPKSSSEIDANLKQFIRVLFRPPESSLNFTGLGLLEKYVQELENHEERAYYVDVLGKGMNGPLNYYRTAKFRHDEELGLQPNLRADLPFLFMWGTMDPTAVPSVMTKSKKFISRYQDVALEGRGHWIMVEAKAEVTEKIAEWLEKLTCGKYSTKL
ncbi:epoxide hydrolase [Laccaria bicolor S238N-H82]|uniref:Epoxide hydrolase n=1 Tax=Laccaria bicolor (strain S238N-H82 / ATCC MYA-4686) TaxID=486041 RepID=B0CXM7_LACBS|nr:epoxide hydrolase [Laccaria bicolor S238N-H82]EDR12290.1 epoxide hydrolase [Laccaria bicolor S238N-H82]|eukprot:XP_001876554.1 epoxide hydrolase [Laccaria bicolor S238N-H82]